MSLANRTATLMVSDPLVKRACEDAVAIGDVRMTGRQMTGLIGRGKLAFSGLGGGAGPKPGSACGAVVTRRISGL